MGGREGDTFGECGRERKKDVSSIIVSEWVRKQVWGFEEKTDWIGKLNDLHDMRKGPRTVGEMWYHHTFAWSYFPIMRYVDG